jgi:UDP-N-acetyl-D-glucosamine dehydrogenase
MSNSFESELRRRIDTREATIVVIGLGYVGLPLAVAFAQRGFVVKGLDLDAGRVEAILSGASYIEDIPAEAVRGEVAAGRLSATTDPAVLTAGDVVVICVPTPLSKTRDPDVSYISASVEMIVPRLRAGQLVILESTSYPGTTREIVLPSLERNGMKVGRDFFLAFSPERIDPGNQRYHLGNTPKIVGGITPSCTALSSALYAAVTPEVVEVTSAESAEMVKLLENTFRMVNIGLVNEIAIMCSRLGIDVWEVIDAASTKPYGFMPFLPGPGLGGHCIPVDPYYLSWKLRTLNYTARFVELAGEVNAAMPEYVVDLVGQGLNAVRLAVNGARVLVVGIAYKRDVADVRESPAIDIIKRLVERGAEVSYHDPFIPRFVTDGRSLESRPLDESSVAAADCVVVVTDHQAVDWGLIARHARLTIDTRNAFKKAGVVPSGRLVKL